MAFTPKTWKNGEDGGTPITAADLNRIEQGVSTIETTPGPQGKTGPKGAAGTNGADGFPTEEQWDLLVARVETLEP